jgi:Mce-associated membrane protein
MSFSARARSTQEQEARMPPSDRTPSVLNGDDGDDGAGSADSVGPDDALALAEEAEAEAAEAEALAAAAAARARALRLRREAAAAAAADTPADTDAVVEAQDADDVVVDVAVADDSAVADADAAAEDTAEPARRRRLRLPRVSLAVLGATLVVLLTLGFLGAGGYMMWQHRQNLAEQQRSAEFAAGARQGVVTLMSLDFNRAEDDVKRILENTTGDFRKDFESQAEDFAQVAQESKVVTEATVNAVAVQSMTQDTARVLLAVTTRVSNVQSQTQEPRSWRLAVDVARDGDQIKLAKVEFVP